MISFVNKVRKYVSFGSAETEVPVQETPAQVPQKQANNIDWAKHAGPKAPCQRIIDFVENGICGHQKFSHGLADTIGATKMACRFREGYLPGQLAQCPCWEFMP